MSGTIGHSKQDGQRNILNKSIYKDMFEKQCNKYRV